MLFSFTSCKKKTYIISFDTDGGSIVENQEVKKKDKLEKPSDPVKEGYVFLYWELDGKEYDFDTKVKNNFTLTAKWKEVVVLIGLEFTKNSDNKSYTVTGIGTCTDQNIVIPSVFHGLPVTSIGDSAFKYCRSLTIYCEATSKPSGWNGYWNYSDCPVVWGYTKE